MADQAFEPGQFVIELWTGLGIAVGQVQAPDQNATNRRLDVTAMRIVAAVRQAAPTLNWFGAMGENSDSVPGFLPMPDGAVARATKRECGKALIRRFEF